MKDQADKQTFFHSFHLLIFTKGANNSGGHSISHRCNSELALNQTYTYTESTFLLVQPPRLQQPQQIRHTHNITAAIRDVCLDHKQTTPFLTL